MASSTIFSAHLLDTADASMEIATHLGAGRLAAGAKDFAFLTGTRISRIAQHQIDIATPNGLPLGTLTRCEPTRNAYHSNDADRHFMFTSHAIIQRERNSRGGYHDARFQRQGKTIKGIVQSMKKNDRAMTEESVTKFLCDRAYEAFAEPLSGINEASISVQRNLLLPLVKHLLGVDKFTVMQHEPQLRKAYEDFLVNNKAHAEATENMKRFANGATFIGTTELAQGALFICTARLHDRTKYEGRAVEYMTPLVRHETLPEEFGGIAAIFKAHLPGINENVSTKHPFGIESYSDRYYEDVDVVYEVSPNMKWTVIPTDIAEDAKYVHLI